MIFLGAIGLLQALFSTQALSALLLTAHFGWLIVIWEQRLGKPAPSLQGRAMLGVAALTPLLSFYVVMLIDRLLGRTPRPAQTEGWRWLLPLGSGALLVLICWQIAFSGPPQEGDLSQMLYGLVPLGGYYLLTLAIVHMAATVFNLTARGPLTSRSQLVAAVPFVLLSLSLAAT